jgi:hypothetical protein
MRPPTEKPDLNSDEVRSAVHQALASQDVAEAIDVLTAPDIDVRGTKVNSDRAHLQALQEVLQWTVGGYDTRPSPETHELKNKDRLHVLVTYRQPPLGDGPPMVGMYDYLCDTLFGIPMRPVSSDVVVPQYQDEDGQIVKPKWIEADWDAFQASGRPRPPPALQPNRYPYQLPLVGGCRAEHWVLWYIHYPWEQPPSPPDETIAADLRQELLLVATARGCNTFDYIWYRNPAMSVPDMFHVQVFWRPTSAAGPPSASPYPSAAASAVVEANPAPSEKGDSKDSTSRKGNSMFSSFLGVVRR